MKDIDIAVRPIDSRWTIWELLKPIDITIEGINIHIPAGFKTDFASVPRILWNIIPPFGRYGTAALVHDYLYYSCVVDKKTADKIFYKLMLRSKVSKWKAWLMYKAVRLFGRRHCGKMVDELKD